MTFGRNLVNSQKKTECNDTKFSFRKTTCDASSLCARLSSLLGSEGVVYFGSCSLCLIGQRYFSPSSPALLTPHELFRQLFVFFFPNITLWHGDFTLLAKHSRGVASSL